MNDGAGVPIEGGQAFAAGERVLLVDSKGRRNLVRLVAGAKHHSHAGVVDLDDAIGHPEGTVLRSEKGARFVAVRPTLSDVIFAMPRGAQVIYPKDIGAILMAGDIRPGDRVLEAGVGSGALSMAMLRVGARVIGYEIREDFASHAKKSVAEALGEEVPYEVQIKDVYEGISDSNLDRIVLDLPEPWRVVPHAEESLLPGGILVCYLPSITQVTELRRALERSRFGLVRTFETLERDWHIAGRAVRPEHRMVGHTGFLTVARLLAPVLEDEGNLPADHAGAEDEYTASSTEPGRDQPDGPAEQL